MTRAEIKGRIIKIVADKMYVNHNEINEESHFKYDIGVDSLDEVELIVEVEHKFGITVSYEDTKDIATIGDAVDAVCRKLGVPESPESGTSKAEQAALKAYPNSKGIRELKGLSARPIFIQGYEQAEKDTIERACNWLFSHLPILVDYYNEDIHTNADRSEFIKLFRTQMEKKQ